MNCFIPEREHSVLCGGVGSDPSLLFVAEYFMWHILCEWQSLHIEGNLERGQTSSGIFIHVFIQKACLVPNIVLGDTLSQRMFPTLHYREEGISSRRNNHDYCILSHKYYTVIIP